MTRSQKPAGKSKSTPDFTSRPSAARVPETPVPETGMPKTALPYISSEKDTPSAGAGPSVSSSGAPASGPVTNIEREQWLFEIGWEVCHQIGGIYTVLKTKAPAIQARWKDKYILVGPYNEQGAQIDFEETPAPEPIRTALEQLEECGVTAYFGRWVIEGRPQVILLDYRPRLSRLHEDKFLLWNDNGIRTEDADFDVDQTISFGFAVTELFRKLSDILPKNSIIAHFHEWMCGVAIPRIVHLQLPVTTLFTTHATLLGRYIASDNPHFYSELRSIDPEKAATHYNIRPRYVIERVAARTATVFTTISDVTAREAEQFLGRSPDIITPNGLNISRFAALHEFQNLHLKYKERIHDFVMGHFFPSYTFDLDRTLYFVASGRYEYRNKGFDIYIEALYRLNQYLKGLPNPPTVVAFLITRAATRHINVQSLQRHLMFEDLRSICTEVQLDLGNRMLHSAARGSIPNLEDLLSVDLQSRLKRSILARRSDKLPAIVTHDMVDDASDPILQHIRHRRLFNQADDPVKIVFHPDFLSSNNPLFGMDYDQFVRGCHLGIFPSYYEPWGYTPPECLALGIPAVTTDLSGFGAFGLRNIPRVHEQGLYVLNRSKKSPFETIEDLTAYLFHFVQQTRRERIEMRNRAERLSELFSWEALGKYYHQAHDLAVTRRLGK